MAYRKNIDLQQRRLRELARSLDSKPAKVFLPQNKSSKKTITKPNIARPAQVVEAKSILKDTTVIIVLAGVILTIQVVLSLTIF